VSNLFIKHMNFLKINQSTHIIIIIISYFIRLICLEQQSIVRAGEGESLRGVAVSFDEILKEEFRILEISGFMVVGLSVNSAEGFLKVFEPENKSSDIIVFQKVFVLFNEFLGSELNVFIKQVDLQKLSLVVPVDVSEDGEVDDGEDISHKSESEIVGEGIVVVCVEEHVDTESSGLVDKLVILDGRIGHIVIPFRINRVEGESFGRNAGSELGGSFNEINHFSDGFISSHTSFLERRQVLITETEEGDGCEVVIHRSSI
jgi:hypothetical protein